MKLFLSWLDSFLFLVAVDPLCVIFPITVTIDVIANVRCKPITSYGMGPAWYPFTYTAK